MPTDELLRVITDASQMFIAYVDREQRYRFVNNTYKQHFGGGSDEIIGMRVNEVLGKAYEKVSRHIETALSGKLAEHESLIHLADGTPRWLSARLVPHKTQDGEVAGFVVLATDVTDRKKAEEALRQSEERYRAVYNHTPVMMHSIDRAGILISVNDHWLKVLGYDRDEVIGRKSIEFLTTESAERAAQQAIPQVFREGGIKDVEFQMVKKNGEVIDVMISAVAEHDDAGAITHTLAIIVDLTERKRAEKALRESEDRLSRILESAMDAIITVDGQLTVRLFNSAAEDVFGCGAAEIIGKSFDRFTSEPLREMLIRSMKDFARAASRKRYLWAPDGLTALRTNGEAFPIEATISRAEAGGERLFTIILRDVNDRRKAEERLRRLQVQNVYLR